MVRRPSLPVVAVLALLAATPGCSDVSVNVLPVTDVEVSPTEVTLLEGEQKVVEVVLRGSRGEALHAHPVRWTSDDPAVAAVEGDGRIQGGSPGTTRVRASAGDVSAAVSVTVRKGPTIGLSARSVRFRGEAGQTTPKEADVEVENIGNGTLAGLGVSVSTADPDAPPWLGAALSGSSAPATLRIQARFDELEPGTHLGEVAVTAAGGPDGPQVVEVEVQVEEPPPQVHLTPPSVGLTAVARSHEPATQVVAVTNLGGTPLTSMETSVEYPGGGPRGWLEAQLDAGTAPTTLGLRALARNLGPGVHRADVHVSSSVPGARGAVLRVTFDVSARPGSSGRGG